MVLRDRKAHLAAFGLLRKALGVVFVLGALFCLLQVSAIDSWSEQLLLGLGFLVLTVGFAVAGGYLLGTLSSDETATTEPERPEFVPENELETSLVKAASEPSQEAQFFDILQESVLYTLLAESGATPMTMSMRFDGSIDPSNDQEEIYLGPWLWAFTSEKRLEQFVSAAPLGEFSILVGEIMEQNGVGQFDVRYLCRFALKNDVPLVLNPYLGCEVNLGEDHVRKLSG